MSGATRVSREVPELAAASRAFNAFLTDFTDPAIVDLCRRRLKQIMRAEDPTLDHDPAETAVSAEQLAELAEWHTSDKFTSAQRAALDMTEYFAHTAQYVTDAQVAALVAALGAEKVLALTNALWSADAFYRLSNFLEILPEEENRR